MLGIVLEILDIERRERQAVGEGAPGDSAEAHSLAWSGLDVGSPFDHPRSGRIPFPRPDDPLASARQRAVAARGGNGFMDVAAAQAARLLAQGAGRLLRTMSDRGVVAILDPISGKIRRVQLRALETERHGPADDQPPAPSAVAAPGTAAPRGPAEFWEEDFPDLKR